MSDGFYLFCLARADRLPALPLEEKGLDGRAPLNVVIINDLAAVWSPVETEDFIGPAADERLQDLTWIGPRVIRHQEVVAKIMQYSPVLPARFGTIFLSLLSLEKNLQRHYNTITVFLDHITDKEEWGVKGLLDRSGAKEKLCALQFFREAERLDTLPPGKRYFEEQRLRARCDQELQHWLQEVCRRVWSKIQDYASEFRERPVQSRKVTGTEKDMVLNWSLLVPARAVHSFQTMIREANTQLSDRGLELECSGPWPPYSFCPCMDMESEA
jgi:hypothetical protein